VGGLVDLDNRAIGKNDFVVDDSIGRETDLVTVEVDTTGKEQTGDTNRAKATTRRSQIRLGQEGVDIGPSNGVGKEDYATARMWWNTYR
jgi:hypothetical protein